jgi:hypothetical protein
MEDKKFVQDKEEVAVEEFSITELEDRLEFLVRSDSKAN